LGPDPGQALDRGRDDAVLGQRPDRDPLQAPHVFVHVVAVGPQRDDWIRDQLPRPVVGDPAAAVGVADLDPLHLVPLARHRQLPLARAPPARVDGRVLEQQQHVGDGPLQARLAQPALGDEPLLVGDQAAADDEDFGAHRRNRCTAPAYPFSTTMAQPKILRPDWLPAVALSAALAALMLAWNPQVGDLAAQVFRTELFQHAGLAIWNGSWYGGHYTLTYSVLFPPLAALLGPQLVGTISVVASSYLFDRLVRDRWGEAARWATLWFAAGVVTLLADGQLTFALGVAFGLATLRCLQRGQAKLSLLAAAACALSSPVAAAFLAGVLLVGAWRSRGPAIWAAAVALALVLVPNLV